MSSTPLFSSVPPSKRFLRDGQARFEGINPRFGGADELPRLEHRVEGAGYLEAQGVADGRIVLPGGFGIRPGRFAGGRVLAARVERNGDQAPGIQVIHLGTSLKLSEELYARWLRMLPKASIGLSLPM